MPYNSAKFQSTFQPITLVTSSRDHVNNKVLDKNRVRKAVFISPQRRKEKSEGAENMLLCARCVGVLKPAFLPGQTLEFETEMTYSDQNSISHPH